MEWRDVGISAIEFRKLEFDVVEGGGTFLFF